jgi:hypothetical protein
MAWWWFRSSSVWIFQDLCKAKKLCPGYCRLWEKSLVLLAGLFIKTTQGLTGMGKGHKFVFRSNYTYLFALHKLFQQITTSSFRWQYNKAEAFF